MFSNTEIRKSIIELMHHYSVNQKELAKMLKTSPSNITKWLAGTQNPALTEQIKITNLYTKTFQLEMDFNSL